MRWLADGTLDHLRRVAEEPDLSATRYRLLGPLARGGMATVYRVHDRELDREAALKVVSVPGELAEELAGRLRREARILARLEHPGIVPVHDLGTLPDGRLFYVMKLVRGSRLDVHARSIDRPAELLRLFTRICEPVAFAHSHGVLHRDLKPENVMVGAFGEVLVMDWGVAHLEAGSALGRRWLEAAAEEDGRRRPADDAAAEAAAEAEVAPGAGTPATIHGTVLGTPGYMAPEQARGESDRLDERTDVYALGALLRFLLSGAGEGRREIPRRLEAICRKSMAAEPAGRYPGVAQLAADVARYLDGLAVEAYREGWLEKLRRLGTKYRTPILLVLAYLVVRALLLIFAGT